MPNACIDPITAAAHIHIALQEINSRELEFQLDGALDLVLMFFEQLCRTQHHGGVHIVAAAVHLARHLGSKFFAGFLLKGQSIHVTAQQDGLAGALAAR